MLVIGKGNPKSAFEVVSEEICFVTWAVSVACAVIPLYSYGEIPDKFCHNL
jgi:hypothetical protein